MLRYRFTKIAGDLGELQPLNMDTSIEQLPRVQALFQDLASTFGQWVTGTAGAAPVLAYSNQLPLQVYEGVLCGHLVLVGEQRVGIMLIDYTV